MDVDMYQDNEEEPTQENGQLEENVSSEKLFQTSVLTNTFT